jgi:hypothetical protein
MAPLMRIKMAAATRYQQAYGVGAGAMLSPRQPMQIFAHS